MTYTKHGHHIPGSPGETQRPAEVARCGGPSLCSKCSKEATDWKNTYGEDELFLRIDEEKAKQSVLRYFAYDHLPTIPAAISMHFYDVARKMDEVLPEGDQKNMSLTHLMIAKDAAVRASLDLI